MHIVKTMDAGLENRWATSTILALSSNHSHSITTIFITLSWYYCNILFHYHGKSEVTMVLPSSPLPCSSLYHMLLCRLRNDL